MIFGEDRLPGSAPMSVQPVRSYCGAWVAWLKAWPRPRDADPCRGNADGGGSPARWQTGCFPLHATDWPYPGVGAGHCRKISSGTGPAADDGVPVRVIPSRPVCGYAGMAGPCGAQRHEGDAVPSLGQNVWKRFSADVRAGDRLLGFRRCGRRGADRRWVDLRVRESGSAVDLCCGQDEQGA
jgi:hypothetical protein